MDKKTFCQILKTLENADNFHDKISNACFEYSTQACTDVTIFGLGLGLEDTIVKLLAEIMGDTSDDISYFCWELDYGTKWEPGMITDQNGADVDFSTAEKLYDYLTRDDK